MFNANKSISFCAMAAVLFVGSSSQSVQAQDQAKEKFNSPFDDAVAAWHMQSNRDSAGANSSATPVGKDARFGVNLKGAEREASLTRGGDEQVLRLDAASLNADQGSDGELNISGKAMSFAIRLNNPSQNWDVTLLSKHGGHEQLTYNVFAFNAPDGGLDLGFELGTDQGFHKASAIIEASELGNWHDIVGRYNGRDMELYFDGTLVATRPVRGNLRDTNTSPLVLGGQVMGKDIGRHFNGLVDHMAVWGRALTDKEVAYLSGVEQTPLYEEPFRPQVHYTPPKNWLNDPNGLVYHNGEYHLFYQYNPFGNRWGHMSWGHAVSTDLMHWEHLPVALPEMDGTMIFSGSAVVDHENTSGFGINGKPPLVAIYTGHHAGKPKRETQDLAFSTDNGRTFTVYENNPVIDIDAEHFRDPKVFWHEPSKQWIMVVALAVQKKISIYGSPDLKAWEHLSDFGPAGATQVPNWECPDLFELPVKNREDQSKWVLQVDVGGRSIAGGSGGQYFIGAFDGKRFVADTPADEIRWVDYGNDFYAAQSWSNEPKGRRVWIAWMSSWPYANRIPTAPWRGAMTLPRRVELRAFGDEVHLIQQPVEEIATLRRKPVTLSDRIIKPGKESLKKDGVAGAVLEIIAEFEVGQANRFGLHVRGGKDQQTVVGYDARKQELYVDRTRSGQTGFAKSFPATHRAPLKSTDGKVKLRIIIDRSSIEVFGGDGQAVITNRIFPDLDSTEVALFAEGGNARLESLTAWELKSIWQPKD